MSVDILVQVAPTGVSAALFALGVSRIADRYLMRGPIVRVRCHTSSTSVYQASTNVQIVLQSLMAITGLSLTAFHPNSSVRPSLPRIRNRGVTDPIERFGLRVHL
jgi:hypothetical protein